MPRGFQKGVLQPENAGSGKRKLLKTVKESILEKKLMIYLFRATYQAPNSLMISQELTYRALQTLYTMKNI